MNGTVRHIWPVSVSVPCTPLPVTGQSAADKISTTSFRSISAFLPAAHGAQLADRGRQQLLCRASDVLRLCPSVFAVPRQCFTLAWHIEKIFKQCLFQRVDFGHLYNKQKLFYRNFQSLWTCVYISKMHVNLFLCVQIWLCALIALVVK